jgi:hypothetical protein
VRIQRKPRGCRVRHIEYTPTTKNNYFCTWLVLNSFIYANGTLRFDGKPSPVSLFHCNNRMSLNLYIMYSCIAYFTCLTLCRVLDWWNVWRPTSTTILEARWKGSC